MGLLLLDIHTFTSPVNAEGCGVQISTGSVHSDAVYCDLHCCVICTAVHYESTMHFQSCAVIDFTRVQTQIALVNAFAQEPMFVLQAGVFSEMM